MSIINLILQKNDLNNKKEAGKPWLPHAFSDFSVNFQEIFYRITLTLSTPSTDAICSSSYADTPVSTSIIVYACSFLLLFVISAMFIPLSANNVVNCPSIFGMFL